MAASEAAPLLHGLPPQLSIPEVPLLSVAVPSSLLNVPPSALGGRVSPTPFFHHGQGGNGVNPTLLSEDVKASAAQLLFLPRFFFCSPHLQAVEKRTSDLLL